MTTSFLHDWRKGLASVLLGSALAASTLFSAGCGTGSQARSTPTAAPATTVVAKVNGEAIEQAELDKALNQFHGADVLRGLIDDKLIAQEAKKDKIVLDDKEVGRKLDELKKSPQYAAMLKAKAMTDADVERFYRRKMELEKLILLEIPEREKMQFYDQYKDQIEQAHIFDILVERKEDAEKIVAQLKAGKDFEQMARENSKDESSKSAGGDLGWVPRGAPLDPALAKVAFTVPANEIAGPIGTKSGWAIIKVTGRRKSYDELKSFIEERLVENRQLEFMQRLRVKADVWNKFEQSGANAAPSGAPAVVSSPGEAVSSPRGAGK